MSSPVPVPEKLVALFRHIEQQLQHTSLGADSWYHLLIAAFVGSTEPELCADVYRHLVSLPRFSSPEQRQALIRQIREMLVKAISVVGVVKAMVAIMAINQHERPEDKDLSVTREGWQCDEQNLDRGMDWKGTSSSALSHVSQSRPLLSLNTSKEMEMVDSRHTTRHSHTRVAAPSFVLSHQFSSALH